MRAGKLDRRIAIYASSIRDNQYGDPEPDHLVELTRVWASVRPAPGSERLTSAENAASAPTVFWVRWSALLAALNPKDEIEYQDRRYGIVSVVEIGRREGLEIAAVGRAD